MNFHALTTGVRFVFHDALTLTMGRNDYRFLDSWTYSATVLSARQTLVTHREFSLPRENDSS